MADSLVLPVEISIVGPCWRTIASPNTERRWWQFWKPKTLRANFHVGTELAIGGTVARPVGLYVNCMLIGEHGTAATIIDSWRDRLVIDGAWAAGHRKGWIMAYH